MSDKNALLVIDMQNDYLWEKRKPMFSYDTDRTRRLKIIYVSYF